MKVKQTPIATAVALSLVSIALTAHAQNAAEPKKEKETTQALESVVVTGIRAAKDKALNLKRVSETHVEVISAEDVGKMPDKNIADSLQRVPGVSISSASGAEGGFDENDKVSMRGTSPSLTQTLVDGHNVAGGEWFILNQTGESGRSVSYTLLPAEIVGQVVVHKSSEASLIEGGTTGSINIKTPNPLDYKEKFGANLNVGAVYSDLAKKSDAQLSGALRFKNEANTFGVIVQAFNEKRHLRRDGVEVLGYEKIQSASGAGEPSPLVQAYPSLAGKLAPSLIGAAFFEQERERTGGLIKAQAKLTKDFSLIGTFYSADLKANNYNRNYMLWGTRLFNGLAPGWNDNKYVQKPVVPTAAPTVVNGVVTAANFADQSGTPSGVYDMISRPSSGSKTDFFDLDASWNVNDRLTLTGKAGSSNGRGYTNTQDVMELDVFGPANFQLNGVKSAPVFSSGRKPDPTVKDTYANDWIWGYQNITTKDKESWGQIDGSYYLADEGLKELKFGVRFTDHDRSLHGAIGQGPKGDWGPNWNMGTPRPYPSDYSFAGNVIPGLWYFTPEQLAAYSAKYSNRDPIKRTDYGMLYTLNEKTSAAYLQGDFGYGKLTGNAGVRFVKTKQGVTGYRAVDGATKPEVSSDFGGFISYANSRSYTDVLPSLNLRYAESRNLIYRGSITKTMTRPDYSVIAGGVNLDSRNVNSPTDIGTGGAPNFNINPVRSTNFDVAVEYYFAPRSMVSASLFYMDMTSLITGGQTKGQFMTEKLNSTTGQVERFLATYNLQSFVNDSGKVKGLELAYEQPLFGNFGVNANFTYTDAERRGGKPMTGASKNTYNLGGYYEDDTWNARVSYSYRSEFLTGNDWTGNAMYALGNGSLAASLGYKVNSMLSLHLDGRNLNNPKLVYYTDTKDQPRAFYNNGRQFYLSARMKF